MPYVPTFYKPPTRARSPALGPPAPSAPNGAPIGGPRTQGGRAAIGSPGTQAQRESREGMLLGGGGVARNAYGEKTDPNALPQWDPYNYKVGAGAAYLNMLRRPSEAAAETENRLRGAVIGDLGASEKTRSVPGMTLFPQLEAARQSQRGAIAGVGGAGADFAALQMEAARAAMTRGGAAADAQAQLLAESGRVGQPAAAGQARLIAQLEDAAAGRGGPSAAELLLARGTDRAASNMASQAAGVRGGNAAAALRNAALAGAEDRRGAVAAGAELRANEQLAARQQLAGVLESTRAGDVSTFGVRGDVARSARDAALAESMGMGHLAGQGREADLARALGLVDAESGARQQDLATLLGVGGLGLQSRSLDDQRRQAAIAQALGLGGFQSGLAQADNQTSLSAAQTLNDYLLGRRSGDIQREQLKMQETGQWLDFAGGLAGAGGALMMGGIPMAGGAAAPPTAGTADALARARAGGAKLNYF